MDLRIGIVQSPRELEIELADDTDRDALKALIDAAISAETTLWVTDKKGAEIGINAERISFVSLGTSDDERRIGFA